MVRDYIVLDEAHKIKSSSTKTAKTVRAIPSRHRVLLTGTPVQNNLREMWALFDFACQGSLLGSGKTFKSEYENPITRAREKDATPGERALGLKISQNLTELIRPYFLRRTKADVQDKKQLESRAREEQQEKAEGERGAVVPSLTRKTDLIIWTFLSAVQENVYRQFISLDHIKELLTTTRSPLAELTVLKKLCDHPRLLSTRAVTQLGLAEGANEFNEDDDDRAQPAPGGIEGVADETLIDESGKLKFLVSLMESLREEGKRTLIFSQSRKMLDIIQQVLTNRKFCLLRVDGTITKLAERERRIKLFQTDARYAVFLLTTQVGGVGLTLTAANRVVIYDPSWNPATDAQAVDRAYRIGQTDDVIIYRLITCGTVEEKIYRRQVFKDSLIRQTTGDKKNPFRYFTKQELKELFTLEDPRSSSTQLQLQSLHSAVCRSDPELQRHVTSLKGMNVFAVSRHDLLFCNEETEDTLQDEETHYINQRVQKAHELVQAESQLQSLMMDSIKQNTEPAWIRLSRQNELKKAASPRHDRSPPAVVDLTQSGSDDPEMLGADGREAPKDESVIDLSEQGADGPALTPTKERSLILTETSGATNGDSPTDSSVAMPGAESDPGSFQGNFNLQLEDSAELLSEVDEEQDPEEPELSAGGGDFQLQMDVTGENMEENEDRLSDGRSQSLVSTPTDESISKLTRRKKKTQVIYDSEEEKEENLVLTSSPLSGIRNLVSSTPKSVLINISRHSLNTSVASRRSLVESLLKDMEEEEEDEKCVSGGVELSEPSEAFETCTDESVVEEAEPSGETLNSENTGKSEEEEEEDEEQEQSFVNDSTELELNSSETVDQCAPSKVHLPTLTSHSQEETFESLVHSGKCTLAEGRKREALDLFLKAIDINAGDAEIQLLVIQLYRQLSQHQP